MKLIMKLQLCKILGNTVSIIPPVANININDIGIANMYTIIATMKRGFK